jgi:hypothetical protein
MYGGFGWFIALLIACRLTASAVAQQPPAGATLAPVAFPAIQSTIQPEEMRQSVILPLDTFRLPDLPMRDVVPRLIHAPDEESTLPAQPIEFVIEKAAARSIEMHPPAADEAPRLGAAASSPPRRTRPPIPQTAAAPAPSSAPGEIAAREKPAAPSMERARSLALTPTADAPPPTTSDVVATLLRRGDELLMLRDIAAARLLYERAAMFGNARAAMLVGKTYDPLFFAETGISGIVADRAKAIEWYSAASALGDGEAAIRTEKLRTASQQ